MVYILHIYIYIYMYVHYFTRIIIIKDGFRRDAKSSSKRLDSCTINCPICRDPVKDAVGNKKGHDAIYCDGLCKQWIHHQCAGLSKANLTALAKSNDSFVCPKCVISKQATDIADLKNSVSSLMKDVEDLKLAMSNNGCLRSAAAVQAADPGSSCQDDKNTKSRNSDNSNNNSRSSSVKKNNLVLLGISEHVCGTRLRDRLTKDYSSVSSVCQSVLSLASTPVAPNVAYTLVECRRLGKFDASRKSPRPVLASFSNSLTPSLILSNKSAIAAKSSADLRGVTIKPDLTREERKAEQLLLKERRNLINSGVDRHRIRIRRNRIILDSKLHGLIVDGELQLVTRCSTPQFNHQDFNETIADDDYSLTTSNTEAMPISTTPPTIQAPPKPGNRSVVSPQ